MKTKRFFSVAIVMLLCSLLLMEPISASAASYGEQNAARTAKLYLLSGAFSKKGLIKQLKFEGYTGKEAKYAVNHCGASWKKQAVKGAKAYLQPFARYTPHGIAIHKNRLTGFLRFG